MTLLEPDLAQPPTSPAKIAAWALHEEVLTWPKPGLVSPVDSGAHDDMDVTLFKTSIQSLIGYFSAIHSAGQSGAALSELRALGIAAEEEMLRATRGINTHRGAIFTLGFLLAAAGRREADDQLARQSLGVIVRKTWGSYIASVQPDSPASNGLRVTHRYGVGGARAEAASGFRAVYEVGLPALREAKMVGWNAAKVQCIFALIANLDDTNLLHRGGPAGLQFAQARTREFLTGGGVLRPGWSQDAIETHREFVNRRLSPGGAGDLLAATILIDLLDPHAISD